MTLKIVKADEPLLMKNICVLIFGEPGVGKTSTAFSAADVLTIDCDRGAHRSAYRKDTVQVDSWEEIAQISKDDLDGYSTVSVDTVGRALDMLAVSVGRRDPKNLRKGSSNLSLQGWGELKSEFTTWLSKLREYGKDVVLIAHDKLDKKGDDDVHRPDIQGGSYGEVLKSADMVGFMYRARDGVYLDFSPSDQWVGKNAPGLEPVKVPHLDKSPRFLAEVIKRSIDLVNARSAESKSVADTVADWRESIESTGDADGINALIAALADAELADAARKQVRKLIASQAKALGLSWDQSNSGYREAA